MTPSAGSKLYEETFTSGLAYQSVGRKPVEAHMLDGNYVIASAVKHPWRKQLNLMVTYLYFYNGLQLLIDRADFLECVQVTTVVHACNVDILQKMYDRFLTMGVGEWRLLLVDPIGRMKETACPSSRARNTAPRAGRAVAP